MPDWKRIRSDFPITKTAVYLDHAAAGAVIPDAWNEVEKYYRENANAGDLSWPAWMKRREETRRAIAHFMNAEPDEIAFTQSTSHGMNLIAELLAQKGKVLANSCEFPSSTLPWVWRGADMIWQEPDRGVLSLSKMKSLFGPSVKTILTSYVQYSTGFRQDLETLGRLKGSRYLVVNATQGLGAFPVDVRKMNIDFLVTNSYKWLMAGYGGGILYMKKQHLSRLKPGSLGWRSVTDPDKMDNRGAVIKDKASRAELGCPAFPAIFALGGSIRYLSSIGTDKISRRILDLHQILRSRLEEEGFEVVSPDAEPQRSGIVVFKLENAVRVWQKLLGQKVCVSARGAGIRAAVHFYNNEDDIEKFIKKLTAVIKR